MLCQWPWFLLRSGWMESGLIQDVNLVSHFGREVANEVFTAAETVGGGWFLAIRGMTAALERIWMPPQIGHHRSSYPSSGLQQLLPPLLTVSQTGNLTSSFSCRPSRQGDSSAAPPSPSFPLSHHTSGSGDPPLGPSESTLTYIPNSVTVDCNCPETSPARQRAWCPGSPGCRQAPRAAGGALPPREPAARGLEMES